MYSCIGAVGNKNIYASLLSHCHPIAPQGRWIYTVCVCVRTHLSPGVVDIYCMCMYMYIYIKGSKEGGCSGDAAAKTHKLK